MLPVIGAAVVLVTLGVMSYFLHGAVKATNDQGKRLNTLELGRLKEKATKQQSDYQLKKANNALKDSMEQIKQNVSNLRGGVLLQSTNSLTPVANAKTAIVLNASDVTAGINLKALGANDTTGIHADANGNLNYSASNGHVFDSTVYIPDSSLVTNKAAYLNQGTVFNNKWHMVGDDSGVVLKSGRMQVPKLVTEDESSTGVLKVANEAIFKGGLSVYNKDNKPTELPGQDGRNRIRGDVMVNGHLSTEGVSRAKSFEAVDEHTVHVGSLGKRVIIGNASEAEVNQAPERAISLMHPVRVKGAIEAEQVVTQQHVDSSNKDLMHVGWLTNKTVLGNSRLQGAADAVSRLPDNTVLLSGHAQVHGALQANGGVRLPSTATLLVDSRNATGGRLTLTADGKLGVGTSDPEHTVTVRGTTYIKPESGTQAYALHVHDDKLHINPRDAQGMWDQKNTVAVTREGNIQASGQVCINGTCLSESEFQEIKAIVKNRVAATSSGGATASLVAGNTRIVYGSAAHWQPYGDNVYVDVYFGNGFKGTPNIFTTIYGKSHHWVVPSGGTVYPSPYDNNSLTSWFRFYLYITSAGLNKDNMAATGSHTLQWMAVGAAQDAIPAPVTMTDSGLVLFLDASNKTSYGGTGNIWFDLSGNKNNFTLNNNVTWNKDGYFLVRGGFAQGPASSAFRIDTDHTVEILCETEPGYDGNNNPYLMHTTIYNLLSTSNERMSMAHTTWSDGNVYYDVRGCCGGDQRVYYRSFNPWLLKHYVFRTNTRAGNNQRQVFENGMSMVSSGGNGTSRYAQWGGRSVLWNYEPGSGTPWHGKFYLIRIYNRALSDSEILQNFRAIHSRGIMI